MFHQNIQSLESRIESLEILLEEINPDIVVLSEHNIKQDEICRLNINKYIVTSHYCRKTTIRGGVLILCKNEFQWKQLCFPAFNELLEDRQFEFCATMFSCNHFKFIVVGIYRSPSSNVHAFLGRFDKLLNFISRKCNYIFLIGDININTLINSKECRSFKNILKGHGMNCLIDFPTRVCATAQTCIDHVLTNFPRQEVKVEGIVTNISDHDAQLVEINGSLDNNTSNNSITKFQRKFSVENNDIFLKCISRESWDSVYNSPVETKYDTFFSIFFYCFDTCFPKVKTKQASRKESWITEDLIKMKNEISRISCLCRETNNQYLKTNLKFKIKDYNRQCKIKKQMYLDSLISESSNVCRETWKIINSETGKKKNIHENIALNINGSVVKNPKIVSEVFNTFYINMVNSQILPKLKNNLTKSCEKNNNETKKLFMPTTITEKELEKIIISFPNKYSTGADEVPMPVIKFARRYLVKPLVHLINSSFISGIFPEKLKISKVKPLFKDGVANCPSNYRPVSMISSFAKLYERAMSIQLTKYLEINSLLDKEQHGFRPGKSVISAATQMIESIIDSLDKGEKTIGAFLDLSKAFDSVVHSDLLNTLNNLGIRGRALNWFSTYLVNRLQFVEVNFVSKLKQLTSVKSNYRTVKYGVPQGSILGPLLFLCYIKGLPQTNKIEQICLYADDINLKISGNTIKDIETSAFIQLSYLDQYLSSKNLLLNPSKTKYVTFSSKKQPENFNIFLNEEMIEEVGETKFLGLKLDKNLNWNSHIDQICSKISSGLFALKRMSKFSNLHTLKQIYFALIHSHIAYGILVYGGTSKSNLNKILILQKKALRIILKLKWNDSVKMHFSELGILTVYSQYIFELCLYIKKNINNFVKNGNYHKYNTRHKNDIAFDRHKLSMFERKPSYSGLKYFNILPNEIKVTEDFNKFKNKLKSMMLKKPLYTLEEFFE